MKLLDRLFRRRVESASFAKERLQIVLAHERAGRIAPDFLPTMQLEIMAVVAKYLEVSPEMIKVNLQQADEMSVLEIDVELDNAKIKPRPSRNPVEEGYVPWKASVS
jgi:cell division topological specificity factor